VPQQDCLVEFCFPEPARLLRGEEDLDSDVLPTPFALPYLSIAPLANALHQVDLLGDGALNLQTQGTSTVTSISSYVELSNSAARAFSTV